VAGNADLRGMLGTVDLLIKVGCLVKQSTISVISKAVNLN